MKPAAPNTSVDHGSSSSDYDSQSSDEQETDDRNNVDDNVVDNSKSQETESEPAGPCLHTDPTLSQSSDDSSYTVTCTVSMVLAVPRGKGFK